MKRRNFIITTSAVALAIASVPVYRYYKKKSKYYNPLASPYELGRFCDEKTIREIGLSYRNLVPAENEKAGLKTLLLTGEDGKKMSESDNVAVFEMLDKKIRRDFNDFNLQVIRGWVISKTEARQCALFSLT